MAVCVLLTHLFSSLMPVNGCRYDYYNLSNSVITVDSVNPLMLACHELFKFHKRLKIANFYGPQTLSGIFCYSPEISNKLQPPADRVCTTVLSAVDHYTIGKFAAEHSKTNASCPEAELEN